MQGLARPNKAHHRPISFDRFESLYRRIPKKEKRCMPTYVLAHRAPMDYVGSPEAAAAWNARFQRLGDNLQDRGNPVFKQRSVGHCGADTVLGGYTLLTADNLDAALQLAEACPALKAGGGIEVGELTLLNSGRQPLD